MAFRFIDVHETAPDYSDTSLAAATLYVDQRTRAMSHWFDVSGMGSVAICRVNLLSHLDRIVTAMRGRNGSSVEAELIEGQLSRVRDCESADDLDKIRVAFKLPKMQELSMSQHASFDYAPQPIRKSSKRRKHADPFDFLAL